MAYLTLFLMALSVAIVSWVFTISVRSIALYSQVIDEPKGGRKIHERPVALWGGFGIGVAIILFTVFLVPLTPELYGFLGGLFVLLIGGMLDDAFDLPPGMQIIFPVLASGIVVASGTRITHITNWSDGSPFFLPLTALPTMVWMLIVTYATKLMDGIDGLVSGQTIIGSFLILALALGMYYQPDVALLAAIVGGAYLGFLPVNFYPAKQFLGESGSTIAGFCLGFLSIVGSAKLATGLMALGLPLVDASIVVAGRLMRGVSPFLGDKTHLHFKLLDAGLSQRQVVFVMWGLSLACGLLALSFQTRGKIVVLSFLVLATLGLSFAAGKYAQRLSK